MVNVRLNNKCEPFLIYVVDLDNKETIFTNLDQAINYYLNFIIMTSYSYINRDVTKVLIKHVLNINGIHKINKQSSISKIYKTKNAYTK